MSWHLNGTEVFTTGDQEPAFTLSVNDLTDPTKLRGVESTTIRLATTKEVRRIAENERMNTGPRADRPILEHGVGTGRTFRQPVIPVRLDRVQSEFIAVGGNAVWFDWAKRTKLNEIDLGVSEAVTKTYQRACWIDPNSTLNFPLIDFGSFEGRASSYDVTEEKLLPAFRIGPLLEDVFATIGYKVVPRIRLATDWKKPGMIAPSDKIQSKPDASSPLRSDPVPNGFGFPSQPVQTAPVTSTPSFMSFDNGGTTGPGYFDDTIGTSVQRYEPTSNTLLSVEIIDFDIVTWDAGMEGARVAFVLWEKTQDIPLGVFWSDPLISIPGFPGIPASPILVSGVYETALIEAGKQVTIGLWNDQGLSGVPATVNINASTSGQAHFVPLTMPYAAGLPLYISSALPKWSVMDLFKAMIDARVLVVDTDPDTKTINVYYYEDYFGVPAPGNVTRDWTKRMDHTTPPAKAIDDVPVRINYEFTEDKSDVTIKGQNALLQSPGYGNATVEIGGYGKEATVKVPFAASAMGFVFDRVRVPIMRDKDASYQEDEYDREPRLLVFDGMAEGNWKHAGDAQTEFPVSYFTWPGDRSLPVGFGNVVVYGDERPEGAIDLYARKKHAMLQSPLLEASLSLRASEVQSFNFGVPTLVDEGNGPAWYYAQEIKAFRPDKHQSTACVMVRMPGALVDAASVTPSNAAIEYPEIIVNPPFVPPRLCTKRFPNTPTLVSYRVSASSQAAVEADTVNYPIGMRLAITCEGGGAGVNWSPWCPDVVERVAPGTGTSGTEWQRLFLPSGSIVENLDFASSTEWDRYLITDNGGFSFCMTFYMFKLSFMDSGGNYDFEPIYDPCGVLMFPTTNINDAFPDLCRKYVIQTNTTADPNTGWVDSSIEFPQVAIFGPVTLPPGALYARVKWTRGLNIQGYSDRTLIV